MGWRRALARVEQRLGRVERQSAAAGVGGAREGSASGLPSAKAQRGFMATIEEWNERYRSGEREEREPSPVVVRASALSTPGRALDIACGTGRNASYLAKRGWKVVALDGSVEALRRLRELAEKDGFSIEPELVDLERGSIDHPAGSFDLVLITHYLQRNLFPVAATLLQPGGLCAAALHLIDPSSILSTPRPRYRVAPQELRALFAEWAVIDYREENGVAEIIARRAEQPPQSLFIHSKTW